MISFCPSNSPKEGIEKLSHPIKEFLDKGEHLSPEGADLLEGFLEKKDQLFRMAGIDESISDVDDFEYLYESDSDHDQWALYGRYEDWNGETDGQDGDDVEWVTDEE